MFQQKYKEKQFLVAQLSSNMGISTLQIVGGCDELLFHEQNT
jgi:hypothetical protein